MNHWKTTGSVTNEAEIIHLGGCVCAELRFRWLASLISGSTCSLVELPEHEVPQQGGTLMAILFQTAHIRAQGVGDVGEEEGDRLRVPLLSLHFQYINLSRFALD